MALLPSTSTSTSARVASSTSSRSEAGYTAAASARDFIDNDGVRWTVREIIPEPRPTKNRTLLTRPGYENGWLSFRSTGIACRIAPFPANWRTLSEFELERWCMRAQHAARIRRKS